MECKEYWRQNKNLLLRGWLESLLRAISIEKEESMVTSDSVILLMNDSIGEHGSLFASLWEFLLRWFLSVVKFKIEINSPIYSLKACLVCVVRVSFCLHPERNLLSPITPKIPSRNLTIIHCIARVKGSWLKS